MNPYCDGATVTLCVLPLSLTSYVIVVVTTPLPLSGGGALAGAGVAAGCAAGSLPRFLGPCSRVLKNCGATLGNIAKVSTSSSEPLHPGRATAASRSSCHSGFNRSAGRLLIGVLPVCL